MIRYFIIIIFFLIIPYPNYLNIPFKPPLTAHILASFDGCTYTLRVVLISECPRIVDTVLTSTLFSIKVLAKVCRNPWNKIGKQSTGNEKK